MKWHIKSIVRNIVAVILSAIIFVIFGIMAVFSFTQQDDTSITIFMCFFALFSGLFLFGSIKQLAASIDKSKQSKQINILEQITGIQKYKTADEMIIAYCQQKQMPIYQDEKIIVTEEFVAETEGKIYLINGILDVIPFVSKVNGFIEYVSLVFLYYDGKRYEIQYRNQLGGSNLKEKANQIQYVANIIARKSVNFRKYPAYSFEE